MASVNWEKFKQSGEAKAMFRHCEAEERMKAEHTNTDVDKSRTHLNMNFGLFDKENAYEALCKEYDEVLQYLDSQPGANKRSDRVTLIGLSIPAPENMDDEKAEDWFIEAYRVLDDMFGDTLLGGTVHFDEIHEYRDPETKEEKMSRAHMHAYVIPVSGDKLNAKAVCSRGNMIALNNSLEAMTTERYPGYRFMDGTKKKSRKSVERLKQESDKADVTIRAHEKAASIIQQAQVEATKIVEAARARADRVETRVADMEWKVEEDREAVRRERAKVEEDRELVNALKSDLKRRRDDFTKERENWLKRVNKELTEVSKLKQEYETASSPSDRMVAFMKQLTTSKGESIYDKFLEREERERMTEQKRRKRIADAISVSERLKEFGEDESKYSL